MGLVRYVDEDKKAQVIELSELERMAEEQELDLILVHESEKENDYSVYKLGDSDKLRYEKQKEAKKQKKANRASVVELKHIKIKDATAEHDLAIKAKSIDKFIQDGCSVLITIEYRGRAYAMIDRGKDKIELLLSMLKREYKFEKPIKVAGNTVQTTISKFNKQ